MGALFLILCPYSTSGCPVQSAQLDNVFTVLTPFLSFSATVYASCSTIGFIISISFSQCVTFFFLSSDIIPTLPISSCSLVSFYQSSWEEDLLKFLEHSLVFASSLAHRVCLYACVLISPEYIYYLYVTEGVEAKNIFRKQKRNIECARMCFCDYCNFLIDCRDRLFYNSILTWLINTSYAPKTFPAVAFLFFSAFHQRINMKPFLIRFKLVNLN